MTYKNTYRQQTEKIFKRGDLIYIRDNHLAQDKHRGGFYSRIRLHGMVGIVLHESGLTHCYNVMVNNKLELVHRKYMKNVDDIILG